MAQRHDIGHQKLLLAQELARARAAKKKRSGGKKTARPAVRSAPRFANWCRTPNHAPSCSCAY